MHNVVPGARQRALCRYMIGHSVCVAVISTDHNLSANRTKLQSSGNLCSFYWIMNAECINAYGFPSVRITSSMSIVLISVLATCKWLSALCCLINLI